MYRAVRTLGIGKQLSGRFGVSEGVVPLAVPLVGFEGQVGKLAVGDLGAGGVVALVPLGLYLESCRGGRASNKLDDSAIRRESPPGPVHRDETEQAMLNLVPLRRARRVVTHVNIEPGLGRKPRKLNLPQPVPVPVRTARIRGDHETFRLRIPRDSHPRVPELIGCVGCSGG